MRAVRISEWGGPEVLEVVDDAPEPEPADGEIRIRVDRAGINFADTHARENVYIARYELPLIPGSEVVGITDDGRRVLALTGTGAYAEVAVAPADRVVEIPGGVSDAQALGVLLQGLTAWHLHRTCGRVREGETVVVHSAAGGVGSLAVQLAKPMGAGRVIATASSEDKRALALELGADAALDVGAEDLAEQITAANGGEPVDVVLELAGGPVFDASYEVLAPFGRLVVYGISSREQNTVRTGSLLRRSRSVIGFWLMHALGRVDMIDEPLRDLFARVADGTLRVVEGETYPLSEVRRAHEDLQGRRTSGKLMLDPRR